MEIGLLPTLFESYNFKKKFSYNHKGEHNIALISGQSLDMNYNLKNK
jgi:hypothetical protein